MRTNTVSASILDSRFYYLFSFLVLFVILSVLPPSTEALIPGLGLLRASVVFFTITVLPGYMLVLALRIDVSPSVQLILYSVGLSIPYVLLLALLLNFVANALGSGYPLTPLRLALVAVVAILVPYIVADRRPPDLSSYIRPLRQTLSRHPMPSLFLLLVPLTSAFGAYMLNTYGTNFTAIGALVLISFIPVLLAFRSIPHELAPLAIVAASIAVLFHTNLVSNHIWGWDIHYQYYVANTVYETGYWDPNLESSYTTLPIITVFATIYSLLAGIDLIWVYKVFYPLLGALVPLGIYVLSQEFRERPVAMFAPFVYVFFYAFFKDMPDKQFLGELYLVLLLIVLFDRRISSYQNWIFGLLFAGAMILSHYAVSFFFVAFAALTIAGVKAVYALSSQEVSIDRVFNPVFVVLVGCFWVVWYHLTGTGVVTETIATLAVETISDSNSIFAERAGADYGSPPLITAPWIIYLLLNIGLASLIGVGLLQLLYSVYMRKKISNEIWYVIFATIVLAFVGSSLVFSYGMGFDRIFKMGLVVLAPFAIVGWTLAAAVLVKLKRRISPPTKDFSTDQVFQGFAVFLLVFFLFSSGAAFWAAGDQVPPYSIGLDRDAGWPVYEQNEVDATRWLDTHDPAAETTVAVYNRWEAIKSRDGLLVSEITLQYHIESIEPDQEGVERSSYIYISDRPIAADTPINPDTPEQFQYVNPEETAFYTTTAERSNKIYDTESTSIYRYTDE